MTNQDRTLLKLDRVSKKFQAVKAVDDLSLEVYQGEIFGFLGPNGAGKTTTISMICGLLKPDSGTILFNGSQKKPSEIRNRIGVCPQTLVLWGKLTCIEQLIFSGELYGIDQNEARRRGNELLAAFGLEEKRSKLASTLSGGMRRRLNLALALVHNPELLVLDEPEAGLDPQSRVMVREFIRNWAREKTGRTVIFTTHNMDEAERLVDRVAIIDHGRLLVMDTPDALKRKQGEGDILEILFEPGTGAEHELRTLLEKAINQKFTVIIRENRLEIRGSGIIASLASIAEILQQSGFVTSELRLREDTLEDVFLSLTGRNLRE